MKVLVIGGTGYLGSAIIDFFSKTCDVVGCSPSGGVTPEGIVIEAIKSNDYRQFCSQKGFDVVVLALGDGNLDRCESDFSYSHLRNVEHYEQWFDAIRCELPYSKVVLFSTIYVFGESMHPRGHDKVDVPVPLSKYGIDKLKSERLLNELQNDSLIIRLPWLVGNVAHKNDPIVKLINNLIAKEKIELDQNVRYPTATSWVACSTLELIKIGVSGTVHLTGSEAISRFELVQLLADKIVPSLSGKITDKGIYPNPDEYSVTAKRPSSTKLAMDNDIALVLPQPPNMSDLIDIYMEDWKKI